MRYLPKIKLPAAIPHIPLMWTLIGLLTAACIFAVVRVTDVQRHQNDALHSIICNAESFVRTSHRLTAEQKRQSLKFYDDSLAKARLAPCK